MKVPMQHEKAMQRIHVKKYAIFTLQMGTMTPVNHLILILWLVIHFAKPCSTRINGSLSHVTFGIIKN